MKIFDLKTGSCLVAQNFRLPHVLLTFLFVFQKEKFCCVKFVVLLIFFMKSDRFVISRRLATVRVAVVSKWPCPGGYPALKSRFGRILQIFCRFLAGFCQKSAGNLQEPAKNSSENGRILPKRDFKAV